MKTFAQAGCSSAAADGADKSTAGSLAAAAAKLLMVHKLQQLL
jgi:hypothetical protein